MIINEAKHIVTLSPLESICNVKRSSLILSPSMQLHSPIWKILEIPRTLNSLLRTPQGWSFQRCWSFNKYILIVDKLQEKDQYLAQTYWQTFKLTRKERRMWWELNTRPAELFQTSDPSSSCWNDTHPRGRQQLKWE